MINCEKYKDDLAKIEEFAFNKNTREVVSCGSLNCEDCIFNERTCAESDKIKWLCKEYKEPILSDDELELIKALGKVAGVNYKYVARDAYGVIKFFETKPHVSGSGNYYTKCRQTYVNITSRDEVLFLPNITHKDGIYDIENKCFIKEEGDD